METLLATFLVLIREGVESILLAGLLTRAVQERYRYHVYVNFSLTWIVTLAIGWYVLDWIWTYIEDIEHVLMLVTAAVLIYIFFNSKKLFAHAKEHAETIKDSNVWVVHLTVFLVVFREALESTVFLGSTIYNDPSNVVMGFILGVPILIAAMIAFFKFNSKFVSDAVFRYMSYFLLVLAAYYMYHGIKEIHLMYFA